MLLVIRLEWVHAKAARDRWDEETLLLKEELGRIVLSFRFYSREWIDRAQQLREDAVLCGQQWAAGYVAYAVKEATAYHRLAESAEAKYTATVGDFTIHHLCDKQWPKGPM